MEQPSTLTEALIMLDDKNKDITDLKKQVSNLKRTKLRLKNKLNKEVDELKQRLIESKSSGSSFTDDWDVILE